MKRILLIDDTRTEEALNCRLDIIARNFWEGIKQLHNNGPWKILYLDHDLNSFSEDGTREYTGYDIMLYLENEKQIGNLEVIPEKIICISSNPPGKKRIEQVIERLYK